MNQPTFLDSLKPATVNSFVVLGAIVTKMALLRGSVLKGFSFPKLEYETYSKNCESGYLTVRDSYTMVKALRGRVVA